MIFVAGKTAIEKFKGLQKAQHATDASIVQSIPSNCPVITAYKAEDEHRPGLS
jgi:hypothetical protein